MCSGTSRCPALRSTPAPPTSSSGPPGLPSPDSPDDAGALLPAGAVLVGDDLDPGLTFRVEVGLIADDHDAYLPVADEAQYGVPVVADDADEFVVPLLGIGDTAGCVGVEVIGGDEHDCAGH